MVAVIGLVLMRLKLLNLSISNLIPEIIEVVVFYFVPIFKRFKHFKIKIMRI